VCVKRGDGKLGAAGNAEKCVQGRKFFTLSDHFLSYLYACVVVSGLAGPGALIPGGMARPVCKQLGGGTVL